MRWRERGRWVGKSVRDEERYGLETEGDGRERESEMEEDMGWRERDREIGDR